MAYGFNNDRSKVEIYTADEIDAKLGDGTVTTLKIADGAVTADKLDNYVSDLLAFENGAYIPTSYTLGNIAIPSGQYVQSSEYLGNKLYVFTSSNDHTCGWVHVVDPATYIIESTTELTPGASVYFNSASVFDSTHIAISESISNKYVDFYDIEADEIVYRKEMAAYNISNVCFIGSTFAVVMPRASERYHIYKPSDNGTFLKCAELDYYPIGNHLRADMTKINETSFAQIFGIGDNASYRPSYVVITNTAGYHVGKIKIPYIETDSEAQGLLFDATNKTMQIIYAHGTVVSFSVPSYLYSGISGLTSVTYDYAPFKTCGEIYTHKYNDTTPDIPYKVEAAVFHDSKSIIQSGVCVRTGRMQAPATIVSSTSAPFSIYAPLYSSNGVVPEYMLRYNLQADGTAVLTTVYDGSSSTTITESNYATQVASLPGTIRFLYYGYDPVMGLYDVSSRVNYNDLVS